MNVTSYRRTRYQRLLIGPDITLVVSAIGVDPEGVGWVRLAVQTPDDPKPNNGLAPDGNGSATKA